MSNKAKQNGQEEEATQDKLIEHTQDKLIAPTKDQLIEHAQDKLTEHTQDKLMEHTHDKLIEHTQDKLISSSKSTEDRRAWYHVNKRLLPAKAIYFSFISAIGSLIPFIPLYMKQLGLSTTETGVLIGVMPFIAFFVQPLFGAVADKTRKHKMVLIFCLLFCGVFFGLLLVPGKVHDKMICKLSNSVLAECNSEGLHLFSNSCDFNNTRVNKYTTKGFKAFANFENLQNSCILQCNNFVSNLMIHFSTCFENGTAKGSHIEQTLNEENTEHLNDSDILYGVFHKYAHISNITKLRPIFPLGQVNLSDTQDWNETCKIGSFHICKLECSSDEESVCGSHDKNASFWIFVSIYLLANTFYAPVLSLVDAMVYNILGNKRYIWGRQRLWGTLGFALFSMTTSFIRDIEKEAKQSVDYSISFYIFSALCVISAFVVKTLNISETFHCHKMLNNVTALLRLPKVIGFLLVVGYLGMMQSVWLGFLFWYLEDLGSNQRIIGLCCVINAVSEIVILFVAGRIIRLIGHVPCLYISLLGYSIRHLTYSFLTNAWFVLPVELLHGICLGLMYAAASAYATIIAPQGMIATLQGVMAGLYFGFGRGCGFLLTGKLFDPISGLGGRWTFRLYSILSLFIMIVYASINIVASRRSRNSKPKHMNETQNIKPETDQASPTCDEPFLDKKIQNDSTV